MKITNLDDRMTKEQLEKEIKKYVKITKNDNDRIEVSELGDLIVKKTSQELPHIKIMLSRLGITTFRTTKDNNVISYYCFIKLKK
jgi:hypothetical protein